MNEKKTSVKRRCFCCRRRGVQLEAFERTYGIRPSQPIRRYCVWVCEECSQLRMIERIVAIKLARISVLEKVPTKG